VRRGVIAHYAVMKVCRLAAPLVIVIGRTYFGLRLRGRKT